ncbi:hypothetical protein C2E23DRAFT_133010 [Lenzites betulinus]|nr:hypothetical protein C2E23DRAFT_133010 [Lenzites betulinus]
MSSISTTIGPMLVGVIVAGILYGVPCSQAYFYYTEYKRDHWGIKLLVAVVMISDGVHQACISQGMYYYLVTQYGNPQALLHLTTSYLAEVFFNYITSFLVQGFFVVRIWRLSGQNVTLVTPIALLVLGSFATGLVYGIKGVLLISSFNTASKLKNLWIIFNGLAAAADVVIAVVLCAILHKSRTGFARTNTLINRLIMFAVNTGLLTSVCACLSLITVIVLPNTFVYIFFFFIIGRLFTISLLATLNARKDLRGSGLDEMSHDMQPTANFSFSNRLPGGIAVRIDTTKESRHDGESQYAGSDNMKHPVEEV